MKKKFSKRHTLLAWSIWIIGLTASAQVYNDFLRFERQEISPVTGRMLWPAFTAILYGKKEILHAFQEDQ